MRKLFFVAINFVKKERRRGEKSLFFPAHGPEVSGVLFLKAFSTDSNLKKSLLCYPLENKLD